MATQYQKRMLVRKTSDLTRLADQFKKNIESATGEYETAFANYQKQSDELMAPYEAAVKQYKEVQMPQYEAAAADYQRRLDDFNRALEDVSNNPTELIPSRFLGGRGDWIEIEGKKYQMSQTSGQYAVPGQYTVKYVGNKYQVFKDCAQ